MRTRQRKTGFTVVEMLMALAILAMLMTAVAVAFDASIQNYHANEALYKTISTGRAALLRITSEVRTAQAVAVIGAGGDPDNTRCSLLTAGGDNVTYRFDAATSTLFLDNNTTAQSYVLCRNVTAMTFNRATVPGDAGTIRNVRIAMTVTDEDGQQPQTLVAAAVLRRNL